MLSRFQPRLHLMPSGVMAEVTDWVFKTLKGLWRSVPSCTGEADHTISQSRDRALVARTSWLYPHICDQDQKVKSISNTTLRFEACNFKQTDTVELGFLLTCLAKGLSGLMHRILLVSRQSRHSCLLKLQRHSHQKQQNLSADAS